MRVQANQFTVKALFSVHNRWIIPNKKHVMDPREKKIFLIDRAHLHERGVQVEVLDEIFFGANMMPWFDLFSNLFDVSLIR